MYSFLFNPENQTAVPTISSEGRRILKNYVKAWKKCNLSQEGGVPLTLAQACRNKMTERDTIHITIPKIDTCKLGRYSNNHEASRDFTLNRRGNENIIPTHRLGSIIVNTVRKELQKIKLIENERDTKKIVILGPSEDIVGFMNNTLNNFIILSVHNNDWSWKLNYDFIHCALGSENLSFENLHDKCPVVLLNTGEQNVLERAILNDTFEEEEIRVFQCEMEWIRQSNNSESPTYKWMSTQIGIQEDLFDDSDSKKQLYINCLVKSDLENPDDSKWKFSPINPTS